MAYYGKCHASLTILIFRARLSNLFGANKLVKYTGIAPGTPPDIDFNDMSFDVYGELSFPSATFRRASRCFVAALLDVQPLIPPEQ